MVRAPPPGAQAVPTCSLGTFTDASLQLLPPAPGRGCADDVSEARFLAQLDEALRVAERVLGSARAPVLPSEVPHAYDDKYALAEAQVAAACVASVHALQAAGLDGASLRAARRWAAAGDAVTLRLAGGTTCAYAREERRELPARAAVTSVESVGGAAVKSTTTSVSTFVTEHLWRCDAQWRLELYRGTGRGEADTLRLGGRAASLELRTSAKVPPRAEASQLPLAEVSLTWLLKQLEEAPDGDDDSCATRFTIDRAGADCATPRRNPQVDAALRAAADLRAWAEAVGYTLRRELLPMDAAPERAPDTAALCADGVPLPCVLFRKPAEADDAPPLAPLTEASPALAALADEGSGSALLDRAGINALLRESSAALAARCAALAAALPSADSAMLTGAEAALLVAADYLRRVAEHLGDGLAYTESLLRKQLVAAVGKVVQPRDFGEYMAYHNRRLLRPAFQPRPFVFAVRRSAQHVPEGLLRVDDGGDAISTMVVEADAPPEALMHFPLSAETQVSFGGQRFLHGYMAHRFGDAPAAELTLLASARQFSSFVVLVGRIASPTRFEPLGAAIVKDKDELRIPLQAAALPTPKEFADAIASLSPAQQRFARAFRGMQLQSTLFGVLVLHVKPQLELLLGLQPDSLTKEVELTQDLMELFCEYQIPSDLLSFGGAADADAATRLAAVKGHVQAMRDMLCRTGDRAIANRVREEAHEHPEHMFANSSSSPPAGMGLFGAASAAPAGAAFFGGGGFGAVPAPAAMMPQRRTFHTAVRPSAMAMGPPPPAPFAMAAPMMMADGAAPSIPDAPPPASGDAGGEAAPPPAAGAPPADEEEAAALCGARDLTKVPGELDAAYEALDRDSALRPTIITPGATWRKKAYASLLSRAATDTALGKPEQESARAAAFDLIDALSRSGALPLRHAALHVLLGATHCFEESLMDTLVKKDVNPIERVERSQLIMAATLHGRPAADMLARAELPRVAAHSAHLFPALGAGGGAL